MNKLTLLRGNREYINIKICADEEIREDAKCY